MWGNRRVYPLLEEITVFASAKLFTAAREGAERIAATNEIVITLHEDTKNPENTVKIAVEPLKLGKEFFHFMFTRIFVMLPFIDSDIESPDKAIHRKDDNIKLYKEDSGHIL